MGETVYILMGSNLGDRERMLAEALDKIGEIPGLELVATSAIYVSDAVEMEGENPSFLNQAVMAEYIYPAHELLSSLERIEHQMGRMNKGDYKPRSIDLDILLFGNEQIHTERLTVPHRKLLERGFALIPLTQIDPELIHPGTNRPLSDFISEEQWESVIVYKDHVARNV